MKEPTCARRYSLTHAAERLRILCRAPFRIGNTYELDRDHEETLQLFDRDIGGKGIGLYVETRLCSSVKDASVLSPCRAMINFQHTGMG